MAKIIPFKAIRPKKGLESKIAALPYDVYSREEAKEEIKREPLSFLRIDRAETQFDDNVNTYADCVYEKASEILWDMVREEQFITEKAPYYYIYELTMKGRSQTGIAACASVDDYMNETIKKHENTREDKELDRICHVDVCNAQTGPIFLAYRSNETINQIVDKAKKREMLYDFVADDGVRHRVWVIDEKEDMEAIEKAFASMNSIYIADGHHRCASAVKVSLKRRKANPDFTGEEEFNYFLSVLFPDDQLMIMDYNRVVKDLNGYSEAEFLEKVKENFMIEPMEKAAPSRKGVFSMYLGNTWYRLTEKEELQSDDAVDGLDVSVLQNYLLQPILGIDDPKTDKRIDFVGGIRGLTELEKRVATDCKVAFALYPTSIEELFRVADEGRLMPPKSTWFEPKLRSGLFIHRI